MPRPRQLPTITRQDSGSYRVVGTVHGEQLHLTVPTMAEAEALQAEWAGAAPLPLLQTSIPSAQIRDAEYLMTTCGDLGVSARAAAHYLTKYYRKSDAPPLSEAAARFIELKQTGKRDADHVGKLKTALRGLMKFLDHDDLALLSVSEVEAYLREATSDCLPRTFNHYRNSINSFLLWCQRRWWVDRVVTQPIEELPLDQTEPDALPAPTAVRLLRYIEGDHPGWILFYTLTTIVGVRPDGEIERMNQELEAGKPVFTDTGFTVIGKGKNGQFRRRFVRWEKVPLFHKWFLAYPPKGRIYPVNANASRSFLSAVRDKFNIGHDHLRHTAATAMRASGMTYADISDIMGNSEGILRKSYVSPRWTELDAQLFYSTVPKANASGQTKVA